MSAFTAGVGGWLGGEACINLTLDQWEKACVLKDTALIIYSVSSPFLPVQRTGLMNKGIMMSALWRQVQLRRNFGSITGGTFEQKR